MGLWCGVAVSSLVSSMRRATALTTIKPDFESDYHRYHSCLSYIPDSLKSITAIIAQLHSELTAYKLTSMCLADVIWLAHGPASWARLAADIATAALVVHRVRIRL